MTLVVDCGNSRIKWAVAGDGRIRDAGSASLLGEDAAAAESMALDALASAVARHPGRVLVASVAPAALDERMAAAIRARGGQPEFAAVTAAAAGIECGYRRPETLGVDRWLAMVAGRRVADGPFVVVGAGTAVTIDSVDAAGRHLGGLILPGERLMLEALATNTGRIGQVPQAAAGRPEGLAMLGRATDEAVGRGSRLAIAAAVDRAVALIARELGDEPTVLVGGGDARLLADWLETRVELRADLVLEGLAIVAQGQE